MKYQKYCIAVCYFLIGMLTLQNCTKAIIDESNVTPTIDRIVKYSGDVELIMFNHCVTCHGGNTPSAGVNLETYTTVRFYTEEGNLVNRINHQTNPMPPSGLLPVEQRQIIEKWVTDGYLEH